jgi:hypothetical protein
MKGNERPKMNANDNIGLHEQGMTRRLKLEADMAGEMSGIERLRMMTNDDI